MKADKRSEDQKDSKNKQPHWNQRGYSLVELLVASVVAGVLVVASASDSTRLLRSNERATSLQLIDSQLQFARSHAMATGKNTIVCGSSTGTECDGQWNAGLLVMNDPAHSNQGTHTPLQVKYGSISFRSFPGNRASVTFLPNGTLDRVSNGSFWYCPNDNTTTGAKRVTLSRAGQISRPMGQRPRAARRACA